MRSCTLLQKGKIYYPIISRGTNEKKKKKVQVYI